MGGVCMGEVRVWEGGMGVRGGGGGTLCVREVETPGEEGSECVKERGRVRGSVVLECTWTG